MFSEVQSITVLVSFAVRRLQEVTGFMVGQEEERSTHRNS